MDVAVVRWTQRDEMAEAIAATLIELGYQTTIFDCHGEIPADAGVVFSFAPYGNFLAVIRRVEAIPVARRPIVVHWNTEGFPDLKLPWAMVYPVSCLRSLVGRLPAYGALGERVSRLALLRWQESRMLRYRYVGDYHYAYKRGLLHVFADSSAVYANIHRHHGLPTIDFPWGSVPTWSADLQLERDIDVLWLGKRGTKRRSDLLDKVRAELHRRGVEIYVADNQERPFIFREERTTMLNRAKITLNITRTWYDDNFSRFAMAAPNRSLIVSEPLLPHCPDYIAGEHYVSAPVDRLADSILYYLENAGDRQRVVENAYQLLSHQLTMANSVRRVMDKVEEVRASRCR